jgi:hypothetical protein
MVEVNPEFPPDLFSKPFKPHVEYYDMDDQKTYEFDDAGNVKVYIPKPKGIQGLVFAYLLVSIIIAAAYLLRPPSRASVA